MHKSPRSLRKGHWYWLVVAAYIAGLASQTLALRNNVGFPLDDSWIHQEIARNLVRYHTFGFTPHVTSSGSSSTLWTLVLAVNYLLFPSHSPVFFALILNAVFVTISGILLWRMAILDELPIAEAVALAILPALSGNYLWLVFIGMEHALFVTLSLLAILLWMRSGRAPLAAPKRPIWSNIATAIVLGALGITRPEGLALIVLLFALYRWCGRTLADVIRTAAITVVLLVPSFLLNLKTSGSLLPLTLRGRLFLYFGTDKLHIGRSTVRALTFETYTKVIQHNFFDSTSAWVLVAVLLAFYGVFVLLRRFPNRTSVLVLWSALQYVSYCFTLPSTGHGGRYQPFVLLLFPSVLAIALIDLVRRASGWLRFSSIVLRSAEVIVVLSIAALTAATLPRWEVGERDSIYDVNHCHRQMAYWLNQHYPAGTRIGVFDIGAIAYFSDMDIIDLGGLVDPNFFTYMLSNRVPQYLREKGADLVILPQDGTKVHFAERLGLVNNPAIRLQAIHTEGIDYQTWLAGNVFSQNAYQYETLYRIVPMDARDSIPAPDH